MSRRQRRELQRKYNKLGLVRKNDFVPAEMLDKYLGQEDKKNNYVGNFSLKWLMENKNFISTAIREYQRLKIKSTEWKQIIVWDYLNGGPVGGEIIVRVINKDDYNEFEIIDGQQRIGAFIEYMEGGFPVVIDDEEYFASDLQKKKPILYEELENLRFSCKWYENITLKDCTHIFKKVNDGDEISHQEWRNSTFGAYSRYVRECSYWGDYVPVHNMFKLVQINKIDTLPNFPTLKIADRRMKQMQWFSELIYLEENGFRNGITQNKHTDWVEDMDPYEEKYDSKIADKLLKYAWQILQAYGAPFHGKSASKCPSPMKLHIQTLFYHELIKESNQGIESINHFVTGWEKVEKRWNSTSENAPWRKETEEEKIDKPMGQFADYFHGKNSNAIKTIMKVLDKEVERDPNQFGLIELDRKRLFDLSDVIKKWEEQGERCSETGERLDINDIVGDHIIPHSKGIKAGGTTTYNNLRVISKHLNLKRGNASIV